MQSRVHETSPAVVTGAVPEGGPALPPRVSWGAILAGGIVAIVIGLTLNVLGIAIGATTVDAQQGDTPSGQAFGIAGGLWLLVANLIGLAVGGYVAARLSGTADETDSILHGLSVWGVGYLLAALLLGNVIGGTAATAFRGAASILGGAAQGAGQAVSSVAGQAAQAADPQRLAERAQSALRTGGDPAAMPSEARNAEIASLLTRRITQGELPQAARERLLSLIAAEYGIPREEAQARLQQAEGKMTQAMAEARQAAREAADAAATGAAVAAYWAFAAMVLGAVAAVLGAHVGTRNRVRLAAARQVA